MIHAHSSSCWLFAFLFLIKQFTTKQRKKKHLKFCLRGTWMCVSAFCIQSIKIRVTRSNALRLQVSPNLSFSFTFVYLSPGEAMELWWYAAAKWKTATLSSTAKIRISITSRRTAAHRGCCPFNLVAGAAGSADTPTWQTTCLFTSLRN